MTFQVLFTISYIALSCAFFPFHTFFCWSTGLFWCCSLIAANCLPLIAAHTLSTRRLRILKHSVFCLRTFLWSLPAFLCFHIVLFCCRINYRTLLYSILTCIISEVLLFWNGMLCACFFSEQLELRHRALGLLFGFIPINFAILMRIIQIVENEITFEEGKNRLDAVRHDSQLCKTRYPLLLVHGVFFRDCRFPPYWGRIPSELMKNGAEIFYGKHQSAASIEESAKELCARIKEICAKGGFEKVNIIAHSKGGLDARAAAALCPQHIASLTTISTPHRGCEFADYLLNNIPSTVQNRIASLYNSAARRKGDHAPDFLAAVRDLTSERCADFDKHSKLPSEIYTQSVGSVLPCPRSGKFPLNFTYSLEKHFVGANDGLASVTSFPFGKKFIMLSPKQKRGISHGDIVDRNRENIPGFDVREFYVQLVNNLKEKGF